MTAKFFSGKDFLNQEKERLKLRVKKMNELNVSPGLGTILVGSDLNSQSYVRRKHKACDEVGMTSHHIELGDGASQAQVLAAIDSMNNNEDIHAFIVQLPLPKQCNEEEALLAIDPKKDADGLHPINLGKLVMGVKAPRPCTPVGIQSLLADNGISISGKHVVIIGRGLTIGRPLANLLTLKEENANATVTVVHTGSGDLSKYTLNADVIIAAVGVPNVVTPDMIKEGVVLVSAGMTFDENRVLIPDISEECAVKASYMTPRIGGVGPTTIAMLLRNTVDACESQL
jgi:methylenetetrahydrofolate dehydrogenase (NADP+)/methenyltetrahydrofolate cyclohydrolase